MSCSYIQTVIRVQLLYINATKYTQSISRKTNMWKIYSILHNTHFQQRNPSFIICVTVLEFARLSGLSVS